MTLIVTLIADGVFPKASHPTTSFSFLQGGPKEGGMRFAFPPYDCYDYLGC